MEYMNIQNPLVDGAVSPREMELIGSFYHEDPGYTYKEGRDFVSPSQSLRWWFFNQGQAKKLAAVGLDMTDADTIQ